MKEYKTFNQQLTILRNRGMIVPQNGAPKRFLEQENYYNVIHIWILPIIEMTILRVFLSRYLF